MIQIFLAHGTGRTGPTEGSTRGPRGPKNSEQMKLTALSVSAEEEQYESAFQIHLFFLRSPLFWNHKLNISKKKLFFFGHFIQNDFPAGCLGPNQAVTPWISGLVSSHQFSMFARFVMRYIASYAFALIVIWYIYHTYHSSFIVLAWKFQVRAESLLAFEEATIKRVALLATLIQWAKLIPVYLPTTVFKWMKILFP